MLNSYSSINKQAEYNLENTINKDILEANNWKYIRMTELTQAKVIETIDDCIIKKCANSK